MRCACDALPAPVICVPAAAFVTQFVTRFKYFGVVPKSVERSG
jgi:hypothetical protein